MKTLALACVALCGLVLTPVRAANVALGGLASASSEGFGGFASLANDGNRDGLYGNGSVSHTFDGDLEFWQVDLGTMTFVDSITLWNRTDCCSNRLSNVRVSVLDGSLVETWGADILNADPVDLLRSLAVPFNTQGRFVRVQSLPGLNIDNNNFIHLAEVEVYGNATSPNVARNPAAVASASSVYEFGPPVLGPGLAIDGSTDGYYNHRGEGGFFHSADSEDPLNPGNSRANAFWQVDLGGDYAINEIDLFSRADCCQGRNSNFRVSVLNDGIEVWGQDFFTGGTFLPANNEAADQSGHLDLTGLTVTGDTVKVQIIGYNNEGNTPGGSSLMIGEVQVFGNAVPEPGAVGLALVGGGMVLLRRRRR